MKMAYVGAKVLYCLSAESVGVATARARGIFGTTQSQAYPAGKER
jgi:hypothetical protein